MATQNQNPNAENQNENQQNRDFTQGNPGTESVQSGKRGLEQNDHTYEGENDVTHSPRKTGQPENESSASDSLKEESKQDADKRPQAGYNQAEHDASDEENPENANDSDPRESKDPNKGTL